MYITEHTYPFSLSLSLSLTYTYTHTHTNTHTHTPHCTQLNNMVGTLFQSRPSDRSVTRCFTIEGCEFG